MKKYFSIAIAAAVLAASCSKNASDSQSPGIDDENAAPEAIVFGSNVITVKSKAGGGLDSWDASQNLYVYGVRRDMSNDFTSQTQIDNVVTNAIYIDNVKALSPREGTSGSIEVYDDPVKQIPFYYQGRTVYDFYGYYVDDAAGAYKEDGVTPDPTVEPNRISLPIIIDGGQDIMIAKPDISEDIKADDTGEANINNSYTAFSARRKVHPKLKFEHQLARFIFKYKGGGDKYNDIKITSVTLSSKSKGTLVIADNQDENSRGIIWDADAEKKLFSLKKKRDGVLVDLDYDGNVVPTNEYMPLGESLLVSPSTENDKEYELTVNLEQISTGNTAKDVYIITPDKITNQETKEPQTAILKGYKYEVSIVIYGLEDIRITAELAGWENGGDIELDPDKWNDNE